MSTTPSVSGAVLRQPWGSQVAHTSEQDAELDARVGVDSEERVALRARHIRVERFCRRQAVVESPGLPRLVNP